jgi:putative PIN family toxin of toxin-antitoxin system
VNRLVVDTNVLVSSFLGTGPPRQILHRIRDAQDLLCLSPPILSEYLGVLRRGGVSDTLLLSLLELLRDPERVLLVEPRLRIAAIQADPQDNMFLECAMAAHANFIISGDRHLRSLAAFRGIPILSPREYLRLAGSPDAR